MKRERRTRELNAHSKRLMFYLGLLAAAAYFAFTGSENAWLAIGISVGILIAILSEMIYRGQERKKHRKLSTKNQKTVENTTEAEGSRPDDGGEKPAQ